jgi:subtilisin family serine protease
VTGCDPTQGQELFKGTSFATPFVAGTAALVRSAWPKLSAGQVADRLVKTASLARGGAGSPDFGAGVVNPYRAVTDTTLAGGGEVAKPSPIPAERPDLVAQRKEAVVVAAGDRARGAATLLIGVAVGGLVLGGLVLAGYRRRWAVTRRV